MGIVLITAPACLANQDGRDRVPAKQRRRGYTFFRTLFFLLKVTLLHCRLSLNRKAGERELVDVITKMRPVSAGRELIRIGGKHDGGYLVPDDFRGISANFSPGTGTRADFEEELARRYSIKSFLADYAVEKPPGQNDLFDFEKKYLGTVNNDRCMRLEDWIESKVGSHNGEECLLQMDIEGAEFEVLLDTPSEVLRRFRIMIIEFHQMERMFVKDALGMIEGLFDKVLRDFCVVHIHPNNRCRLYKVGNVAIPSLLEVTFYRRDRAVFDNAKVSFPHRLDRKNVPYRPDVVLPTIWQH